MNSGWPVKWRSGNFGGLVGLERRISRLVWKSQFRSCFSWHSGTWDTETKTESKIAGDTNRLEDRGILKNI